MNLISLIVISMVGEAVWETLKITWDKGKIHCDRIGALMIGVILAFATGADIFLAVGINTKIPYLGIFLTGILISRGSNFTHDLVASVNNIYQNTKSPSSKG